MHTIARFAFSLTAALGLFGCINGCVNELDIENGDLFEPIDEQDNLDEQGLYSCSERSDTGYRSGSSFPIKVVTVDGRPVERDTANAYIVMQEAARKAGVTIRIVSGFRTNSEQQYFYNCYVNCSCNGCHLAARPGYSNHQSGHALDLNTSSPGVYSWLSRNGGRFGFRETVAGEPWHWEWWGGGPGGGPCGSNLPRGCATGNFTGVYCDDDSSSHEAAHNTLWKKLDVHIRCADKGGHRAFCPSKKVTRAETIYAITRGFDAPLNGHPNAFSDDNGHKYEKYLNAGSAHSLLKGKDRKVKPDSELTRSGLALILARAFVLPAADKDYFDDDDGSSHEDAHNRVAAAGLMNGTSDGHGRRDFKPSQKANRSSLALVLQRAYQKRLKPRWDLPDACVAGRFDGRFCDDDGMNTEGNHDRLQTELRTPFSCGSINDRPTYCPSKQATRAQAIYVLTSAAGIPLAGHPNGFRDDNSHPKERYFNAAKAFGIVHGYNNGTELRPDNLTTRDTIAVLLDRIYDLPEATQDYFFDDDGSPNEALHNRVAAAGLMLGSSDGQHQRRIFGGSKKATRSQLATVAVRAKDRQLVPVWE